MILVIVESCAKAKLIEKYLGEIPELRHLGKFSVIASMGHITEIPVKKKGYNTKTWAVEYVPIDGKRALISKMKSKSAHAESVYLATDADMEGEAIASHLCVSLGLAEEKCKRVTFIEITKEALKNAFLNPRTIDVSKVQAQEARRVLDRVVGYEVSPLLWNRFPAEPNSNTLSAGRVQSAALKLLVDRAVAFETHTPTPFWTLEGVFTAKGLSMPLCASSVEKWEDAGLVMDLLRTINCENENSRGTWALSTVRKDVFKSPSPPYTTCTLQQDAYNYLKMPAKSTMQVCQQLYEGGHITYMRTDSTTISDDAKWAICQLPEVMNAPSETETHPNQRRAKQNKSVQGAHEAIRPTAFASGDTPTLDGQHAKLYNLIWRRTVASQMKSAQYVEFAFTISQGSTGSTIPIVLHGTQSLLVDEGFLKVWQPGSKTAIIALAEWDILHNTSTTTCKPTSLTAAGDVSRPKPLHNEPGLIKALEREGIGRPSTYVSTVDKLYEKRYVEKGAPVHTGFPTKVCSWSVTFDTLGTFDQVPRIEKVDRDLVLNDSADRMIPTELGRKVIAYLECATPFLLDVKFTANMESDLDLISRGDVNKNDMLSRFYNHFSECVTKAADENKSAVPMPANTTNPAKIFRTFTIDNESYDVRQTKYGVVVYNINTKKCINLAAFFEWRKCNVESLTDRDVEFLVSLPKELGSGFSLAYGKYGLYLVQGKNNVRLEKSKWDDYFDGKL
jgi:DNA topoisomerase-1